MAHKHAVARNYGHPWTGESGWDLLELKADTEEELTECIVRAERKFWHVWIRDNTGQKTAVLYKPAGANKPWQDGPGVGGKTSWQYKGEQRA